MPDLPKQHSDAHTRHGARQHRTASRNSHPKLYATQRWRLSRLSFLSRNPLCIHCLEKGETTAATDVDHIEPHKGDLKKFWTTANWQALCKSCHSRKTATEDGGFGNAPKHPTS